MRRATLTHLSTALLLTAARERSRLRAACTAASMPGACPRATAPVAAMPRSVGACPAFGCPQLTRTRAWPRSPGDFAADVAALFVAAKSRGGASARWAGEAELDFQCLWRAAGLGQPSRCAAPADAGSPRRSDALQRVPRLSASGTLKLASSLGATGFAHDADAAGADSRWAAA